VAWAARRTRPDTDRVAGTTKKSLLLYSAGDVEEGWAGS
jgi:hypothetical protein